MTPFDLPGHVLTLRPARLPFTGVIEYCKLRLRSPSVNALGAPNQENDRLFQKVRMPLCKLAIWLGIILVCPLCAIAQQPAKKSKFEVETTWPGIHFKFVRIERILDERLLIVVRIVATPKAPATGTFIGVKPLVPPGATPEELRSGRYEPRPFSLASSVMIDDLTSQRFPALAPISPPGKEYVPAEVFASLLPGRAEVLTLQFRAPPAPPLAVADNRAPEKQTVSLLLTNAKAPITAIPIPSLDAKQFSAQ